MSNIEKIRQEIERRMLELARDKYIDLHDTLCRTKELNLLLAFIDSMPEDDPLNDPKFCEGFDVGRKVQKIFDEPEEACKESLQVQETCKENQDSFTSLEEAAKEYMKKARKHLFDDSPIGRADDAFIAGAKWMESQMPMPEDTVIFMKGVAEGRRLEREDREENKRKEDELPRFYGD